MLLQISEPQTIQQKKEIDSVAIGIDLGTTNSLVAFCTEPNDVQIIEIDHHKLVPSMVSFEGESTFVGNQISETNKNYAYKSFKRYMNNPASLIQSTNKTHEKSPVELSAILLDYLVKNAQKKLEKNISKAVITVPAFFDETSRQATKDAAKLVGIEVLRLISEPTSAALAYNLDHGPEGIYAVYDLGGGTFDFSILNMQKGVFHVLGTCGDTHLGGDDIDIAIANKWQPSVYLSPEILYQAKCAKEYLTYNESFQSSSVSKYRINRNEFNLLIDPLLDRTFDIIENTLASLSLNINSILGIILVGGPTRIPHLQKRVSEFFKKDPLTNLDPDTIVARGAALQAYALTAGQGTLLLDVTPLSLGIETFGGLSEKIINRNSQIPIAVEQEFTTYAENQTAMSIHVIQGEQEIAAQCRSLARFELKEIPPMPAGRARIKVKFHLDVDGLLEVTATEQTYGVHQQIIVKPSYGLTEDDLMTILNEHFQTIHKDMEQRLLIDAKINAEKLLYHSNHALELDGSLLEPTEIKEIKQLIDDLTITLNNEYVTCDIIKEQMNALKNGTHIFAKRRIEAAIAR